MGNNRKPISNRESPIGNELTSPPKKILVGLMPTGLSVPGYPAAPLSLLWIQENGHDIESLLATGIYYPIYKEELDDATRTKSTSEDTIGEGDTSQRDSSSVLHESTGDGEHVE